MCFQRSSERIKRRVPAAVAQVEGRSTVEDWLPRNSCRQVCSVFVARAASINVRNGAKYDQFTKRNASQDFYQYDKAEHSLPCGRTHPTEVYAI